MRLCRRLYVRACGARVERHGAVVGAFDVGVVGVLLVRAAGEQHVLHVRLGMLLDALRLGLPRVLQHLAAAQRRAEEADAAIVRCAQPRDDVRHGRTRGGARETVVQHDGESHVRLDVVEQGAQFVVHDVVVGDVVGTENLVVLLLVAIGVGLVRPVRRVREDEHVTRLRALQEGLDAVEHPLLGRVLVEDDRDVPEAVELLEDTAPGRRVVDAAVEIGPVVRVVVDADAECLLGHRVLLVCCPVSAGSASQPSQP